VLINRGYADPLPLINVPIYTSSAFTLLTISPSSFQMMYSSLATWHCEYAYCLKINKELELSQNSFYVVVNFS
jgi:hypothetical protein